MFPFDTYALQLQDIEADSFKGQTFSIDLGSVEQAMNEEGAIEIDSLKTSEMIMKVLDNSTAAVQIPENIISDIPECGTGLTLRLIYYVFLTDVLFQSQNENASTIGSVILSTRITCAENRSLPTPIILHFQTNDKV